MSSVTAATRPSRTSGGTSETRPKSRYASSPVLRRRNKFPPCGSACITPVSMSCESVHRMPRSINGSDASRLEQISSSQVTTQSVSSPEASRSACAASNASFSPGLGETSEITLSPSSHSITNTRRVAGSDGMSPGTRTYPGAGSALLFVPVGPYSASNLRMFFASFAKSISSKIRLANSSTAATACALNRRPAVASSTFAAARSSAASAATRAAMPGRCTLTATVRPATVPLYTCDRLAAAMALPPSKTPKTRGHSCATMARANSMGAASMSSCSLSSAVASSAPTKSPRLASAWPNLTYVGPSRSIVGTRFS
mmetsp:Transcript_5661/g.24026  ORF Transcript_5661/g.24026 Transcript_5661/m.24026 type:complete len:314 (-) Transcript_5661:422-1363(-)